VNLAELPSAERRRIRQLAAEEKAWRERAARLEFGEPDPDMARVHLLEYIRLLHPWYLAGWYHRELCQELDLFSRAVTRRQSPRLMISAPPRSGKSQIVSRDLPVHHLGRNPDHSIVIATYGQDLANEMSRDAMLVRDQSLGLWPHLAPSGRNGVEHWQTAGGGSVLAVGAGGPLTGRDMDVGILDDIIKNWEEAQSKTICDSRWNWYASTFYTRLEPGGGIISMQTRWSENDPNGRMMRQAAEGAENWKMLVFPAIAEKDEYDARGNLLRREGEALHPERYDLPALEQIRKVLPPRVWGALYRQAPASDAGGIFDADWLLKRYAHDPQRPPTPYDEILVSIDGTFDDPATSDFVSIVAIGRKGRAEFHVLDEIHRRMDFVATRAALRDFTVKWRPSTILIERAANGFALISELKSEFAGVIGFTPAEYGSKKQRAIMSTSYYAAGNVYFPRAPFVSDMVEELKDYPAGANDDRVDALSQAFIHWQQKWQKGADDKALAANLADLAKSYGWNG
jgi:predicted phage terminase large subunit-like protein